MPYDPTPVLHTLPGGGTATANVYVLPPSEAGPIEIAAGVAREIDVPFFRGLPDWQWLIAQNLQLADSEITTVRLFGTAPNRVLLASIEFNRVTNSAIWRNGAGSQLATLILAPSTGEVNAPPIMNLFDGELTNFITDWLTGEMVESGSWRTTAPHPAVEGDTFDLSGQGFTSATANLNNGGAMFYDANDVFISGSQQGTTNTDQVVTHTAPAGTAFVRFSLSNNAPRIVNVEGPVVPVVDEIDLAIALNQDNGQMQVYARYLDVTRNGEIGYGVADRIIRPIAGGNFGPNTDFTVEVFPALQAATAVALEITSPANVTSGEIIGVRKPLVAVGDSITDDRLAASYGPILATAFSEERYVFNIAVGGASLRRVDGTRGTIGDMFFAGPDKMPGVIVVMGNGGGSRNDLRFFDNGTDRNRMLFGRLILNAQEEIATAVVMGNLPDSFDHDNFYGGPNDLIIIDLLRSPLDDTPQELLLAEDIRQGLSNLAYELHPFDAVWVDVSGYTGGFSTSHPTNPELLAPLVRDAYENNVRAPAPPVEGVDLPEPNEVIVGATTNGQPGTVALPPTSQVEEGEEYGPNGSLQGTLVIVGPTPVDARDLRAGVEQEFGDTGTLAVPTPAQVLEGVAVDDGVGTLMVGDGGMVMVPSDDAQVIVSAVIAGIEREDGKLVGVATELSKVERSENPVEAGGIVAKRLYESDGVTIATNADGSPAEILEQTV